MNCYAAIWLCTAAALVASANGSTDTEGEEQRGVQPQNDEQVVTAWPSGLVPPPWTPIVVRERSLSCWNRVYEFGDKLFPAQITSGGVDLLAGPVHLSVKVDPEPELSWSGVEQEWRDVQFAVEQADPEMAVVTTRAESERLQAECRYRFEFDGMLLCELSVRPRSGSVLVRRMDLVIPFRPDQVRLFHHNPVKPLTQWDLDNDPFNSGAVPPEGLFRPFTHTLWVGNERRGLQWFAESDEGLSPLGDFISLNREGRLTLSLSGLRRLERDRPFRFVFGLIASPVKPMRPTDDIRWTWHIIGHETLEPDSPDPLPRLQNYAAAGVNASFALSLPDILRRAPGNREYANAVRRLHRAGQQAGINLGACISWITLQPEWHSTPVGADHTWLMYPVLAMGTEGGTIYYPCVRSPFGEWLAEAAARAARDLEAPGLYLDGPGIAVLCANRAHGCGYEDDRGIHPTLPILAARDLMKRLYRVFHSGPNPGLIVAHMSGFMQLPSLSFADATLGTEHIAGWPLGETNRHTLEVFRAEVQGRQYGIPSQWLFKNPERPTLYAALSLLHDICPVTYDGVTPEFVRAYREFGAFEAEWVGYWEPHRPVDTTDPRLTVSSYLKPGQGTLTTVANLTKEPVTARLTFDEGALGLQGPRVIRVVFSQKATVDADDDPNRLVMEPGGWALVRIGQAEEGH